MVHSSIRKRNGSPRNRTSPIAALKFLVILFTERSQFLGGIGPEAKPDYRKKKLVLFSPNKCQPRLLKVNLVRVVIGPGSEGP